MIKTASRKLLSNKGFQFAPKENIIVDFDIGFLSVEFKRHVLHAPYHILYSRGRERMARKPDVALVITASGSKLTFFDTIND